MAQPQPVSRGPVPTIAALAPAMAGAVASRAPLTQIWLPGAHVAARRPLAATSRGGQIAAGSKGLVIAVTDAGSCTVRFHCGLVAVNLDGHDIAPIRRCTRA